MPLFVGLREIAKSVLSAAANHVVPRDETRPLVSGLQAGRTHTRWNARTTAVGPRNLSSASFHPSVLHLFVLKPATAGIFHLSRAHAKSPRTEKRKNKKKTSDKKITTPHCLDTCYEVTTSLSDRDHPVGEKRGTSPNTNIATMDNAPTLPAVLPPDKACEKHDGHR